MWKFLVLILFTSCIIEPPDLSGISEDDSFFIRKVDVECEDTVAICSDQSANAYEAIVMYTTDTCQDFDLSSPVVAMGTSTVSCDDDTCFSTHNEFTESNGEVALESLPAGRYSLVSFIDVNANSFPDSDEPYLCAHEIQISALKANARIQVVMVRLRSETPADDADDDDDSDADDDDDGPASDDDDDGDTDD